MQFQPGDIVKFKASFYPREDHQAARYEILDDRCMKVLCCPWVKSMEGQLARYYPGWFSVVELAPESLPVKSIDEFL